MLMKECVVNINKYLWGSSWLLREMKKWASSRRDFLLIFPSNSPNAVQIAKYVWYSACKRRKNMRALQKCCKGRHPTLIFIWDVVVYVVIFTTHSVIWYEILLLLFNAKCAGKYAVVGCIRFRLCLYLDLYMFHLYFYGLGHASYYQREEVIRFCLYGTNVLYLLSPRLHQSSISLV